MGSQYYDWDAAWTVVDYGGGTDWTSVAMADEGDLVSDAMSLDGKVAALVSVTAVEDNTGACNGNLYVYLCRDADGTNYEDFTADDDNDLPELLGVIVPAQNKTRRGVFAISAELVDGFKIAIDNDSGQELAISVKIKYATLALA